MACSDSLRGTDWYVRLRQEFEKSYWTDLHTFVDAERARFAVYPPENEVFAALRLTPWSDVEAVILGQDPYHEHGQAHGLCFSVRNGVPPPPSLRSIFQEMEDDDLPTPSPGAGSLESWARRGVLLLNTTLTVREGAAGSHRRQGWETFTDEVIRVTSAKPDRVVFLLWGCDAQKKSELIDASRHVIIRSSHPSPQAARRRCRDSPPFRGSHPFSRANEALVTGGCEEIDWRLTGASGSNVSGASWRGLFSRSSVSKDAYFARATIEPDLVALCKQLGVPHRLKARMFCPSYEAWSFLDGGVTKIHPYGMGSSWGTRVYGSSALRYLLHSFRAEPPRRRLRGETEVPSVEDLSSMMQRSRAATRIDAESALDQLFLRAFGSLLEDWLPLDE